MQDSSNPTSVVSTSPVPADAPAADADQVTVIPAPKFLVAWSQSITGFLQKNGITGVTVTPNGAEVAADTTTNDLALAIQKLYTARNQQAGIAVTLDFAVGRLVNEYCAREEISRAQAISDLGLTSMLGKAAKTLEKYCRMDEMIGEDHRPPNLSTSHYDAVISFSAPTDPVKLGEFNERREGLLLEAAADPKERGKSWLMEKMRELQKEFDIAPKRKEGQATVLKRFACTSFALMRLDDEQLSDIGRSRAGLTDKWENDYAHLVEVGVIAPEIENLAL